MSYDTRVLRKFSNKIDVEKAVKTVENFPLDPQICGIFKDETKSVKTVNLWKISLERKMWKNGKKK